MAYTQRTADWVIQKAWVEAKAKGVAPLVGTTKYTVLLSLVDSEQKNWEEEEGTEWNSLYGLVNAGTVTATDTFVMPTSINHISKREGDYIYLLSPDGTQKRRVRYIRPDQLYEYRFRTAVARVGRNLQFSKPFAADSSSLGYSIIVPSYKFTDDITTGSSLVQCDNPMFLAYMVAASYARNDLIKQGQYQNILDKATVLMDRMKENNNGSLDEVTLPVFAEGISWT